MGLDATTIRFLFAQRHRNFSKTLTLGRQHFYASNKELKTILLDYGVFDSEFASTLAEKYGPNRYADTFWKDFGVRELSTMDASAFEHANIVHDLNEPVPKQLINSFDAVCDFGTIEHVFNAVQAIKNCMMLVKPGGIFISQAPCNNYAGHGFFQFSPEFFFRAFTAANGFTLCNVSIVEYSPLKRLVSVHDPNESKMRTQLINCFPTVLFVVAKKQTDVEPFTVWPQQSDYAAQWSNEFAPTQRGPVDKFSSVSFKTKSFLVNTCPVLARVLEALRYSPLNKDWTLRNSKTFTKHIDFVNKL